MSTGTLCSTHKHFVPRLVRWACGPFSLKRRVEPGPTGRDLPDAEPHVSALESERPIRRRLVWAGMAGRALLVLLFGSFVLATFVFRQDISLMFTLHQLRAIDGTPNIYRIEYYDDGWVGVNKIEPFELRQPDSSEYSVLPEREEAFHREATGFSVVERARLVPTRDAAVSNSLTK